MQITPMGVTVWPVMTVTATQTVPVDKRMCSTYISRILPNSAVVQWRAADLLSKLVSWFLFCVLIMCISLAMWLFTLYIWHGKESKLCQQWRWYATYFQANFQCSWFEAHTHAAWYGYRIVRVTRLIILPSIVCKILWMSHFTRDNDIAFVWYNEISFKPSQPAKQVFFRKRECWCRNRKLYSELTFQWNAM